MEVELHVVYLSLGSNLGNRELNIEQAIDKIAQTCGTVTNISRLYESPPWGYESKNSYLNNCIELSTELSPNELLDNLKKIEENLGRQFSTNYSDRPIDIDILFYDNTVVNQENLKIPHPLLAKRAFVLKPMNDLNANFMHPQHFLTISQLHYNLAEHTLTKVFAKENE